MPGLPWLVSAVPGVVPGAMTVYLAVRAMDTVLAVLELPEVVVAAVDHTETGRLAQPLGQVRPGLMLPQTLAVEAAAVIPAVMVETVALATVFYIG